MKKYYRGIKKFDGNVDAKRMVISEYVNIKPNSIFVGGNQIDDNTLSESIGHADKNGNIVFSGDILDVSKWTDKIKYTAICWDVDKVGWGDNFDINGDDGCDFRKMLCYSVVVGNIYQNPELLCEE